MKDAARSRAGCPRAGPRLAQRGAPGSHTVGPRRAESRPQARSSLLLVLKSTSVCPRPHPGRRRPQPPKLRLPWTSTEALSDRPGDRWAARHDPQAALVVSGSRSVGDCDNLSAWTIVPVQGAPNGDANVKAALQ